MVSLQLNRKRANFFARGRRNFALLVVAFGFISSIALAEDFADELPRIPPTSPQDALKTFTVAPGFKIELVASEPLIGTPVAIEWDADGRMYVCEMRGYSENRDDAISSIALLTDDNDDGVYDRRTTFADGLFWPTAIFPFDGGLFVGDAPHLYYFKDTDGDGKADEKKTVLTGFGTSNVQGLMNSFRWGLDNRIHVACSSTGGQIRRADAGDDAKPINIRGRDIAFHPRTFEFQPTSGAAQHGMCFDDWGRKYVSSNSNHIQQVMYEDHHVARNPHLRAPSSRVSIAADGPQAEVYRASPVEPWRIVRTRLRVAGQVPGPIEGGGRAAGYFTGATGVTIYRGDAWPAQWKGMAIVGDVGSNLVHRKRLQPNGLEFVAKRIDKESEFITSSDIWFRPAQFANAPDGSLHVIDVCREVIEHPKSLPPAIKQHLDLTAGRDRGRIYRVVPDGFEYRRTPKLNRASSHDLVELLGHPNAWHRETAARLLYERQDQSVIESLESLAANETAPLGRLHAIYVLKGLGALDDRVLIGRLEDSHPLVRAHAVRLAEEASSANIAEKLVEMADDESLDVRYQLAFALGSVQHAKRVPALARLIRRNVDDRWIQLAVQSSVRDDAAGLFDVLAADQAIWNRQGAAFLQSLVMQVIDQNRGADTSLVIQRLATLPAAATAYALPILGEVMKVARSRQGSFLHKFYQDGLLVELKENVDVLSRQSAVLASDVDVRTSIRVDAIKSLAFAPATQAVPVLMSLIDNRQPNQVQAAAIQVMGRFQDRRVANTLIAAWRGFSPGLREAASEVMFARQERISALFDAIDDGTLKPSDVARPRLKLAAKSRNTELVDRAAKYLEAVSDSGREPVLKKYQAALDLAGDFARGKAAFKKHCAVCHKVEGFGYELGPNLATMKSRGGEAILVNVIDPNREVNPQYLNYIALTVDGRAITGMITAESANSVTLTRAEGAKDIVLRHEIEQLRNLRVSIMPEGLEDSIGVQTMADIIAYLMQAN